jgi:hypothetical protein
MWDVATGSLIRTFKGHDTGVLALAFSPDGTRVLSGGDWTIKLWDTATGAKTRTFDSAWVHSAVFSPDGTRIASSSNEGTIKLWDATSGALVRTLSGHSGPVISTAFSRDGRRLLSGAKDGTVRIWDLATGQWSASLLAGGDHEWLAIAPAGFFAASRKGTNLLSIARGMEVISVDQIHQSLFNPDLLREALGGDPTGEMREAANAINLEKVVDSGPAPIVAVISPGEGSQFAGDLVTVTARIEDRGKGVGRIEWRVNGVTAAVEAKPGGSGQIYTVSQQLALDPDDNTVEVIAYNRSNLLASLPGRTTIKFTGPAERARPKLHIIAIGINAHADRGSPFRFGPLGLAVKDAKAFADTMQKAAASLYEEVRVTLALDKDATHDNLKKIVATVAAKVHPRDSCILFAAGHGTSENGQFYFIPQDYQSAPGNLERRAIGQHHLQDWLANRIKARRALILLDTCESGALIGGHTRSRIDTPASEAAVGRLHEATGRPVLTAAATGQFAHEGLIGATGERHGVFTWAVLDALRNGDTNGNGAIELSELVRHVQSVVPRVAEGLARAATSEPVLGKQTARFGSRGEDFVVARRLH